ncbi:hypothetical protein AKJ64_02435 [candidate division MSBL1 archaeon SCGC-AAA259E17]|uniref:Uncharacterized protein n=1 Tax=candidate division MSBL1 archaeon SCGC-AAA259E17 TaxID=1698263 RepID=A0A133UEV3_9EURY|nr:hypothetical protein AKJ64_02435 [candidate division MSBL1 archaeon SCGC-AAA259E17]
MRGDGKPTLRVVQSLGRIETEEDMKRAKRIEEAYKKSEKIVRLGDPDSILCSPMGLSFPFPMHLVLPMSWRSPATLT